jgi:DNA-binding transcriptional ArsR family regulator
MAAKPKFTQQQMETARLCKALGHPARVYIMERLSSMQSCCTSGEMIGDIPIARSTLSQHLKELKIAGLIQGEIDPPMIKYCINRKNWEAAKILLSNLINNEKG